MFTSNIIIGDFGCGMNIGAIQISAVKKTPC